MKSKEFIIEGPLEQVPPHEQQAYKNIYNHHFYKPGQHNDTDDAEVNPFEDNPELEHLGIGADATVFKYSNQNGVIKVIGTWMQLKTCAHLQYLLATKKYANSNPYFPRIMAIQELPNVSDAAPDAKGFVVRTERLEEMGSVGFEERELMISRIYGEDHADIIKMAIGSYTFTDGVRAGLFGHRKKEVIDPAFIQAKKVIISVAQKINPYNPMSMVDLHDGNIMIRRTQFGPQLVITDPLYNTDFSKY